MKHPHRLHLGPLLCSQVEHISKRESLSSSLEWFIRIMSFTARLMSSAARKVTGTPAIFLARSKRKGLERAPLLMVREWTRYTSILRLLPARGQGRVGGGLAIREHHSQTVG